MTFILLVLFDDEIKSRKLNLLNIVWESDEWKIICFINLLRAAAQTVKNAEANRMFGNRFQHLGC